MIAERPGGVSPNEPSRSTPDTKAQREEKQRVEKVREIDPDEEAQRRKRKFQMMMGDEDNLSDLSQEDRAPSPFETTFYTTSAPPVGRKTTADAQTTSSSFMAQPPASAEEDFGVDDAVVPSPAYSPPPNVNAAPPPVEEEEPQQNSLPRSGQFWSETDSPPETPLPSSKMTETPYSAAKNNGQPVPILPGASGAKKPDKKEAKTDAFGPPVPGKPVKKEASPFGMPGKAPKTGEMKGKKEETPPPFFAPGKPEKGKEPSAKAVPGAPPVKGTEAAGRFFDEKGQPLDAKRKGVEKFEEEKAPSARYLSREEEQAPHEQRIVPFKEKKAGAPARGEPASKQAEEKKGIPARLSEKEGEKQAFVSGRKDKEREKRDGERAKERAALEILPPSLPPLPPHIQPMAAAAVQQAQPYISPQTAELFFQMVGTIYYMASPPGISRTEIVLNNPAYADSKFFGSRITIEKYATAPDSFNIRLTGSDEAVVQFRENIPNLMSAFQNGNYAFRIGRLEAEYTIERPVFRRKDREEDKGMGGDMGERRK